MQTENDDMVVLVFWRGLQAWEPSTARLLLDLSRGSGTFLDVGANVGLAALLVATGSPATTVHAFEPVPRIFGRLQRNAALNPNLANLALHQLALSNASGQALIYVPRREWSTMPNDVSLLADFREDTDAVPVELATLDDFTRQNGIDRVDLLKIDTEGTEHLVLEGGLGTLTRDRPFVICEVLAGWPAEPHIGRTLFDLGYRAFHLRESGPEPSSAAAGDPTYRDLNYLFVPDDRQQDLPGWFREAIE
jgi:FkbM family methyltransferase